MTVTDDRRDRLWGPMEWEDRIDAIKDEWPSVAASLDGTFNWKAAFDRDIDLLGAILRDVLRTDQAEPGRPGPKPNLDRHRSEGRLDEWMGKDPTDRPYSYQPFAPTLRLLCRNKSHRQAARKVGVPPSTLYHLMRGARPSTPLLEQVAKAFGKSPSYFIEWRQRMILGTVIAGLEANPEHSVRYYETMRRLEVQ